MSDPTYSPPTSGPYDTGSTQLGGSSGTSSSTTGAASSESRRVAQDAAESSKHVGRVAADEAGSVVQEAKGQARSLIDQASSQLSEQASTQKDSLVTWLRSLADELRSMVDGAKSQQSQQSEEDGSQQSQPGYARDLAERGANYAHQTASWLEDRQPNDVFQEVGRFARRRPGTFLVMAATAGVVVGRLTRGLTASSDDSGQSRLGTSSSAGYGTGYSTGYGTSTGTGYSTGYGTGSETGYGTAPTTGYEYAAPVTGTREDPLGVVGESDIDLPVTGTRPGMESQRHEIGTTSIPSTTTSSVEAGGYAEDGR